LENPQWALGIELSEEAAPVAASAGGGGGSNSRRAAAAAAAAAAVGEWKELRAPELTEELKKEARLASEGLEGGIDRPTRGGR
jgi:hypothetical protein